MSLLSPNQGHSINVTAMEGESRAQMVPTLHSNKSHGAWLPLYKLTLPSSMSRAPDLLLSLVSFSATLFLAKYLRKFGILLLFFSLRLLATLRLAFFSTPSWLALEWLGYSVHSFGCCQYNHREG
jgi:hypothetical protein